MRRRRRSGPLVRGRDGSWVLELDENEREVLLVSVAQLRNLLQSDADEERTRRLHPVAYSTDQEANEEWQRLMRDDLVTSRVAAIDAVEARLRDEGSFDDAQLTGLMITVNALRLVLGTLLDVTEDAPDFVTDPDALDPGSPESAQWHLYMWLGWLLEWIVEAQEPGDEDPGNG